MVFFRFNERNFTWPERGRKGRKERKREREKYDIVNTKKKRIFLLLHFIIIIIIIITIQVSDDVFDENDAIDVSKTKIQ